MKNKKVNKKIFINLLFAILIMLHFSCISFIYYKIPKENTLIILKIQSMIVLTLAIVLIEISYRKGNANIGRNSIEILILAIHNLSIAHIVEIQQINFLSYTYVSAIIFTIYYIAKIIWIRTKEKKEYLNSLSDIKEIVANTPTKKEASKKINERGNFK